MIVRRTVTWDVSFVEAESELVDLDSPGITEYAAVRDLMVVCGCESVTIERGSLLRIRYERC